MTLYISIQVVMKYQKEHRSSLTCLPCTGTPSYGTTQQNSVLRDTLMKQETWPSPQIFCHFPPEDVSVLVSPWPRWNCMSSLEHCCKDSTSILSLAKKSTCHAEKIHLLMVQRKTSLWWKSVKIVCGYLVLRTDCSQYQDLTSTL